METHPGEKAMWKRSQRLERGSPKPKNASRCWHHRSWKRKEAGCPPSLWREACHTDKLGFRLPVSDVCEIYTYFKPPT